MLRPIAMVAPLTVSCRVDIVDISRYQDLYPRRPGHLVSRLTNLNTASRCSCGHLSLNTHTSDKCLGPSSQDPRQSHVCETETGGDVPHAQCPGCWHQRELWAVVWTVSSHKVEAAPVVATISWSPPCHNQYCTLYCITNTLPCRLQTHCLIYLFTDLLFHFSSLSSQ